MEKPKIKAKPLFLTDKPDKRSSSLSDDSCESVEGASIAGKRVSASVQRQLNRAFRNLPRFEASLDSDGNRIKYDIREDEEQFEKCSLILQTLLEAGYFRATIKGLSDFDKIVGGMTWCIQLCNVNIDIDLFYKDSLSIGQKIALTEKIVRTLGRMQCPYPLEPHQIQGMDCIHIYPVLQWLVKQSIEFRQQMENYIKSFGVWQFNANHNISSDEDFITIVHSESTNRLMQELARRDHARQRLHDRRQQLSALLQAVRQHVCTTEETLTEYGARVDDIERQICMLQSEKQQLLIGSSDVPVAEDSPNMSNEHVALLSAHFSVACEVQEMKSRLGAEKGRLREQFDRIINQEPDEAAEDDHMNHVLTEEQQHLAEVNRNLAQLSRQVSILQRKIDAIPLHSELMHYQKRFVELYNQVSGKHIETKKLFVLYNQLEDTKTELVKQINLLDSIQTSFELAFCKKEAGRNEFVTQLETIQRSIGAMKKSLNQKLDQEQQTKTQLDAKLQQMADMQHEYNDLLKQLRTEIKLNEKLTAQMS